MLTRWLSSVRSMVDEGRAAAPLSLPVCDLAITCPARIQQLMADIEAGGDVLTIQDFALEHRALARVFAVTSTQVTFKCNLGVGVDDSIHANLVTRSRLGALMFTCTLYRTRLGGLWRAELPHEVLCLQSRRHRRVPVGVAPEVEVELELARPLAGARVLDVSEQGLGVLVPAPEFDPEALHLGGTLRLNGMQLVIPALRLAHAREKRAGLHVGLDMGPWPEHEARAMRRWLNEAEAALRAMR